MEIREKLYSLLRLLLEEGEELALMQIAIQQEIKDEIVSATTPEEAYAVKLKLEAAASLWTKIEELASRAPEGEQE